MQLQRELGWRTNNQYSNILLEELNNRKSVGLWWTMSPWRTNRRCKNRHLRRGTADYFSFRGKAGLVSSQLCFGALHWTVQGRPLRTNSPTSFSIWAWMYCTEECIAFVFSAPIMQFPLAKQNHFSAEQPREQKAKGNSGFCLVFMGSQNDQIFPSVWSVMVPK